MLGDPTLARLNQVTSVSMCDSEFCATKSIPSCNPGVHTGATFLLTSRTKLNQVVIKIFLPKSFLDQFSLDDKQFIIECNMKILSATKPPPHHTRPRRFLCIFKTILLHLQVNNHKEILKRPQTLMNSPILLWYTSPHPMELRMLLTLTKSCPSTAR